MSPDTASLSLGGPPEGQTAKGQSPFALPLRLATPSALGSLSSVALSSEKANAILTCPPALYNAHPSQADISTLRHTGHFYFALTSVGEHS